MRPAARGEESVAGIVLVEVLTALSIVAVMSALMLGFLGQLRAVASIEGEAAARTELMHAAGHLRRSIAAARAAPLAGGDPEDAIVFEGAPERMRFVAVARRGFGSLALREVTIALRRTGGATALVETIAPRRQGQATAAETFVLVPSLAGIRFEYADADGEFAATWTGDQLPHAVRITLARNLARGRVTAATVARLR